MLLYPARGRRMEHVMVMNVSLESHHTPQGDVGNHTDLKFPSDCKSYYTPQGDVGSLVIEHRPTLGSLSHPARGHRRPPRFTAQFCAAKRGGCFFVKFWAVPDFFRNFSNCGSFHSFYIRIQTVSHWKFPQKSGRNFSVSGVFLCRIPCYNGNKPFQTCFSHIPLLFCPKEMIP